MPSVRKTSARFSSGSSSTPGLAATTAVAICSM